MTSELDRAAAIISAAKSVVVLTGAGMSAESGVPTFRDVQTGLWSRYNPQELATPEAFKRNPALVFGWYVNRLKAMRTAVPHPGHRALARLEEDKDWIVTVVTQNVDGLHTRAGSRNVVHLHGSLEAFRCSGCRDPYPVEKVLEMEAMGAEIDPPSCAKCDNLIRPGVVWFGEVLPVDAVSAAWRVAETAEAALVVGTSALVYPAAGLPAAVRAGGGRVIEINPEETPLSAQADLAWRATAQESLPALVDVLQNRRDGFGNRGAEF